MTIYKHQENNLLKILTFTLLALLIPIVLVVLSNRKFFTNNLRATNFPSQLPIVGLNKPLNQQELNDYIRQENDRFVPNAFTLNPNIFYLTYFITKETYDYFPTVYKDEHLYFFLRRHADKLRKMVYEKTHKQWVDMRRVVLIENNVVTPNSNWMFYANWGSPQQGFKDSDGVFLVPTRYDPSLSSFYDKSQKIDYGLLHEIGHQFLHYPDIYALDYDLESSIATLPDEWQRYDEGDRFWSDRPYSLMGGPSGYPGFDSIKRMRRLSDWETYRLKFINNIHDFAYNLNRYRGFINEFPKTIVLNFGKEYAGKRIDIYQTSAPSIHSRRDERSLKIIRVSLLDDMGKFAFDNPFQSAAIIPPEFPISGYPTIYQDLFGTFFIHIKDGRNNTIAWRWLDAVDLQLPVLNKTISPNSKVEFLLKASTINDHPNTFNWSITAKPISDLPEPQVCTYILKRVPRMVIDHALANPQSILGFNQIERGQPKIWLNLENPSANFHPMNNPLVFKVNCQN